MGLNIDPTSMTNAAKTGPVRILSYRLASSSAEGGPAVIFETGFGFVPGSMPSLSTTYNCILLQEAIALKGVSTARIAFDGEVTTVPDCFD